MKSADSFEGFEFFGETNIDRNRADESRYLEVSRDAPGRSLLSGASQSQR